MTIDIKDFYLNTPMSRYEYMRLKLSDLSANFFKQYDLTAKVTGDMDMSTSKSNVECTDSHKADFSHRSYWRNA